MNLEGPGIIPLLIDLPPANVKGLALADELSSWEESPGPARLLEMQPRLTEAHATLERLSILSRQGVERCLEAQAIPASWIPVGF